MKSVEFALLNFLNHKTIFQFIQHKVRQMNLFFLNHWHKGPKTESLHPCWLYLPHDRILSVFFWWHLSNALTWRCYSVQLHQGGSARTVWHAAKLPAVTFIGSESMWKSKRICSLKWWTSTLQSHFYFCKNKQEIKTLLFKVYTFNFLQTSLCLEIQVS